MGIVLAILTEIVTIMLTAAVLFAGSMRTTGGNYGDSRNALAVFVSGTIMAALIGSSHWIGW